MSGELAKHPESVVLPLLLPDSPVVVWWPAQGARRPGRPTRSARSASAGSPTRPRLERGRAPAILTQATQLRAGQHRPLVDPADAVAGAARRRARPVPRQGHGRRRRGRAGQPERRPAGRLAVPTGCTSTSTGRTRRVPASPRSPARPAADRSTISRPDGLLAEFSIPNAPEPPVALKRRETGRAARRGAAAARPGRRLRRDGRAAVQDATDQERHAGVPRPRRRRHDGRRRQADRHDASSRPRRPPAQPTGSAAARRRRNRQAAAPRRRPRSARPRRLAAQASRRQLMARPTVLVHRTPDELAEAVCARLITTPGRRPVRRPGAALGADRRHHRRPRSTRRSRPSTARDAVDWSRGRALVGRRALPARRTTPTATRPRPARPCSTSSASTRRGCIRWRQPDAVGDDPDLAADDVRGRAGARPPGPRTTAACRHSTSLMLGVGPDGHVASLFPERPALYDERPVVGGAQLAQAAADPGHHDDAGPAARPRGLVRRLRRGQGAGCPPGTVRGRRGADPGRRSARPPAHPLAARPGGRLAAPRRASPALSGLPRSDAGRWHSGAGHVRARSGVATRPSLRLTRRASGSTSWVSPAASGRPRQAAGVVGTLTPFGDSLKCPPRTGCPRFSPSTRAAGRRESVEDDLA